MLFDIRRLAWDEELCALLGVDPGAAAGAAALRPRLRHHLGVRRRGAGGGDRRRPAGGALRPGLPRARHGEEHLRHRQLRPAQHRRRGAGARRGPADHGRLRARGGGRLRARGLDLRHRRRRAVAARRAGDHRRGGGERGAGRLARGQRRRLLRPGADRPRLAPLGPLRARHDRRPHPRQRPRPPGAGGAGGDRLPDGRRGARRGGGRRASGWRS